LVGHKEAAEQKQDSGGSKNGQGSKQKDERVIVSFRASRVVK